MKRFILLLLLLVSLVPTVSADSSNYNITDVYIDGVKGTDSNKIQVELDSTVTLRVYIEGTGETTDVTLKAWIGGYEHGTIEVYSETFDVEDGVLYIETLELDIPEDLDASGDEFTLYVELYDSENREKEEFTLFIEQERHDVVVEEILVSSSTVSPGDYVGVKVRLENQGETDEEDLRVVVSIDELGISSVVYLDELLSGDQDETSTVYLTIPSDAATGSYDVNVNVEYNHGYSEVTDRTYLRVDGSAVESDEDAIVSISSVTSMEVGEEKTYTVQVTNLGESTQTYYLTVEGMNADYTEELVVSAGSSGAMYFTLSAEETGIENVVVSLSSGDGLVVQEVYSVNVEEAGMAGWVILIVLLVLVALGLGVYAYRK